MLTGSVAMAPAEFEGEEEIRHGPHTQVLADNATAGLFQSEVTVVEIGEFRQCASGIQLRHESKPCAPALLERLEDKTCLLTITEGKYHQVKRMFAACGNKVVALHREAIGAIELDPSLMPGEFRPLTAGETQLENNV